MKKALFILILFFSLANLTDMILFFLLGKNGPIGDSNPAIVLFGSSIWLYIIKIGFMVAIWWLFSKYEEIKGNEFKKYFLILVVLLGAIALSFGAYTNIIALQHPEYIEQAAKVPSSEKIAYYFNFMKYVFFLPLIAGLLAFMIWQWANGKARKK
jgi:glucan phosphoethanolaminetransferase (alkaline phosphatase superfamily)